MEKTTIAFIGVVLLGGFLWYRQQERYRDGAEKITPIKDGSSYVVHGGQIFLRNSDGNPPAGVMMAAAVAKPGTAPVEPVFVMEAIAANNGSRREVIRESLKGQAVSDELPVDGAILYLTQAVEPVPSSPNSPDSAAASDRPPIPAARRFLSGVPPRNDNRKRRTFPRQLAPSSQPVILHRCPTDGGAITKTPLDVAAYRLDSLPHVLTKEGLYWMRPVWKERHFLTEERKSGSSVVGGGGNPLRMTGMAIGAPGGVGSRGMAIGTQSATPTAHYEIVTEEIYQGDDLMFSPADGGPAQKRASGLVLESLSATEDAIFGFGLCPTPGHSRAVYRIARRENTPPINLHDFPTDDEGMPFPRTPFFLEYQDRVYWIERYRLEDDETSTATNQETGRVVSTRLDGSERRTVWEARDNTGRLMFPRQILTHRGKLYLLFSQARLVPVPPPDDLRIDWNHGIARLEPEHSPSLGAALALPSSTYLIGVDRMSQRPAYADDGYLYFVVPEEKRSPLDFLSARTTVKVEMALCRSKLPE
jgi:hypothetical protein